jgi:protein TonB
MINSAFSQSDTPIYKFVDEMPVFQDSVNSNSFNKYLLNSIELLNVESDFLSGGRVIVKYCIDTAGYTTDIWITRGISPKVDSAIISAVKNSPRWIPGKLKGKPVKVSFMLPIDIHPQ